MVDGPAFNNPSRWMVGDQEVVSRYNRDELTGRSMFTAIHATTYTWLDRSFHALLSLVPEAVKSNQIQYGTSARAVADLRGISVRTGTMRLIISNLANMRHHPLQVHKGYSCNSTPSVTSTHT